MEEGELILWLLLPPRILESLKSVVPEPNDETDNFLACAADLLLDIGGAVYTTEDPTSSFVGGEGGEP